MENVILFIKYLAASNTINFLLMVLLLCWIFKKLDLNGMFSSGIRSEANKIAESEKEKEAAGKNFYDVRVEFERLSARLADINKEAVSSANEICKSIDKDTDISVDSVRENIIKTLRNEEKRLSSEVTEETVLKVVSKVKDKIKSSLKDYPQIGESLIEQSIGELEEAKL